MWLEEGFRTLHDVQSFRGVRNPARSQNARFSLAHRLAARFSGAGNASRKPETTVTEATTAGWSTTAGDVSVPGDEIVPLAPLSQAQRAASGGLSWQCLSQADR